MSNFKTINQQQDFYVPDLKLKLSGSIAPKSIMHDIIQVEYTDRLTQPGSCTITLNNWDENKQEFKYLEEKKLDLGENLSLDLGYRSSGLTTVFSGKIVASEPNFPPTGQPTIKISGLNLLSQFMASPQTKVYEEKSLKNIVSEIGERLGVKIKGPKDTLANQIAEYWIQVNEPDLLFLMRLAESFDYDICVDESGSDPTLVFGKVENGKKSDYELMYGRSLIEFTPKIDATRLKGSMTVTGSNQLEPFEEDGEITYTAKLSDVSSPALVNKFARKFSHQQGKIVNAPVKTKAAAAALAKGQLAQLVDQVVTGSGSTIGLPELRTGSKLNLTGLGKRFSGQYFVTESTHLIDANGYTTNFKCRLEN